MSAVDQRSHHSPATEKKFKLVGPGFFFFGCANEVKTCGLAQQLILRIIRDLIKHLTRSCRTQTNKVILSSIVPRYDNLSEKATRVNKCLKKE